MHSSSVSNEQDRGEHMWLLGVFFVVGFLFCFFSPSCPLWHLPLVG